MEKYQGETAFVKAIPFKRLERAPKRIHPEPSSGDPTYTVECHRDDLILFRHDTEETGKDFAYILGPTDRKVYLPTGTSYRLVARDTTGTRPGMLVIREKSDFFAVFLPPPILATIPEIILYTPFMHHYAFRFAAYDGFVYPEFPQQ